MSKENAKRLSACYEELKNSISAVVKQGLGRGFSLNYK